MSRTPYLNKQLAEYVFNNKLPDFYLDTKYYLAFHTKFPGFAGTQSKHEVNFPGYARPSIYRDFESWEVIVDGDEVLVKNKVELPIPTPDVETDETFKYITIGRSLLDDSEILYIVEVEETGFSLTQPKSIPIGGAKFLDISRFSNG